MRAGFLIAAVAAGAFVMTACRRTTHEPAAGRTAAAGAPPSASLIDEGSTFVFVKIPEAIMPLDRGSKYEDPLDEALTRARLGTVTGGGSRLGRPDATGAQHVEWVGIDVELADLEKGLPFLASELRRLGAPNSTVLEFKHDGRARSIEIDKVEPSSPSP